MVSYTGRVAYRSAASERVMEPERLGDENRMSVVDHLSELRRRLIVSVAALVIGVTAAFIAQDWVFYLIKRPLRNMEEVGTDLLTFSPTEPLLTVIKVSAYAGLLVALPVILWQVWAFIMPALHEKEKKAVLPYVLLTTLLFLAGVAFGYFVVLPVGLAFMVGYGGDIFQQQLRANDYIGFVTMLLLGFGVVFELPAVVLVLSGAGLVDDVMLRGLRKYAMLAIALVSMIITPGDPVTMLLMMAPLYLLYETSILLARWQGRRERRRQEKAQR